MVFVGVSALSGLVWYPVARSMVGPIRPEDLATQPRFLMITVTAVGLIFGVLYRAARMILEERPSLWFAAFFPLVAANVYLAQTYVFGKFPFLGSGTDQLFGSWFMFNVVFGILFSWILIPLAVPYLYVLSKIHGWIEAWSQKATRRTISRCAWACGGLALIGATDGPRYHRQLLAEERRGLIEVLDANIPADAELIRRGSSGNMLPGIDAVWFRGSGRLPWPPSEAAQALTHHDPRDEMAKRARHSVNVAIDSKTEFRQLKWSKNDHTIQATLVRTPHEDYIEFIRW